MNSERIRILTHIYRNHYDEWADSGENPCRRWAAAAVCRRGFDLSAKDFTGMLEQSMEQAAELLDGGEEKTLESILFLCRNGRENEVRRAFERLLDEDGGSIELLQEKLLQFSDGCNKMLEELAPEDGRLRLGLWSGLNFLALIRPERDFFFRAPEVTAFAGYAEAEEEIGYDRFLNLANYYKNAQELCDELSGEAELRKTVRKRLEQYGKKLGIPDLEDADPRGHLLAFDVMRAVYAMNWYAEKSAKRKSRISTVSQRKIDRMQKAAQLLEERESAAARTREARAEENGASLPQLTGKRAVHKSFGEGTIVSQNGRYLTVEFAKGQKKFALPGAVVNGYLTLAGPEEDSGRDSGNTQNGAEGSLPIPPEKIGEACRQMAEAGKKLQDAEKALEALDVQLKMLLTL